MISLYACSCENDMKSLFEISDLGRESMTKCLYCIFMVAETESLTKKRYINYQHNAGIFIACVYLLVKLLIICKHALLH